MYSIISLTPLAVLTVVNWGEGVGLIFGRHFSECSEVLHASIHFLH